MTSLRLERVSRRYGGLIALDDISLDIPMHGITAIIGPNGAGKTTLFNVVAGSSAPSAGRVLFAGEDITGLSAERIAKRGLIRTFQLAHLFDTLTVLENVKIGRHLHTRGGLLTALLPLRAARSEAAVEATARMLLALTGLASEARVLAAALPYGQKRLLEITRALAAEPRLLLLDEPAAGLNREETNLLAALLRKVAESGTGIVLIEHDMSLVMTVADRIAVLDFGRLIAEGMPNEVRQNRDVIAAYLGTAEASRV